jgi:hypothetical protein
VEAELLHRSPSPWATIASAAISTSWPRKYEWALL